MKFGLHICFGTHKKVAYAKKSYKPYFPEILDAKVDQFVFEFATREMYEIENWPKWAPDRELWRRRDRRTQPLLRDGRGRR